MLENASRQLFLVILTILASLVCVLTLDVPFGHDLKGGTQLRYEVPPDVLEVMKTKESISVDQIMEQSISVITDRIDPTGALDPRITRSGDTGILIELPYFKDKQELKRVLERIANIGKLEMRIVADQDFRRDQVTFVMQAEKARLENWLKNPDNKKLISDDPRNIRRFNEDPTLGPVQIGNLAWYPHQVRPHSTEGETWDRPYATVETLQQSTVKAYDDADYNNGQIPAAFQQKELKDRFLIEFVALNMKERFFTGEDLDPSGVSAGVGNDGGLAVHYAVTPNLMSDYADWSEQYIGKCSAIALNGYVKSAPVFRDKIPGRGIIEGGFTQEEVDELVKVLRTGSLRVEPELQSKQEIGPTLGRAAVERGVYSLLIGGVLVFAFMLFYYRTAGTIACITLALNVFLLWAAMVFMQATITLPGLGGIVLTMGMAVDANVLIYERIREELNKGKDMLRAVRAGFERAMSAILDSNITTFLVGIVLFNVGVGPVRGFAVTLMVGIVVTLFTQFFVTRLLFHFALAKDKLADWQPRTLFDGLNVDFAKHMGKCLVASTLVIGAGLAYATFVAPREVTMGIDFLGGADLQMVVKQPTTADAIRQSLGQDADFQREFPNATVNTVGVESSGQFRNFNVRLKLNDRQRAAIEVARKAWRDQKNAAVKADLEPPAPYEPPYVTELRRVFKEQLVAPAFSDPIATKQPDRENLQYAQLTVHLQQPVLVAAAREQLQKGLSGSMVTPLPDEAAPEARDLIVEWTTQISTKPWEFASIVAKELSALQDTTNNPVVLSEPFPEAQEIQGRLVNDLRNAAIGALLLSWLLIVLYLRVRFHEYRYGLAAVIALVHDVLVAFCVIVFVNHMGWVHVEISLSMVACFLTIIGYSVNDTIVIFDRIRENRLDNARAGIVEPLRGLINRALNQTLSRTILTTTLTLFVVLAQFLVNWGSDSDLESFAFGMIVGMIAGVYSTVFIAAPILVWMDKGEPSVPAAAAVPAAVGKPGV